LFDAESQEQDGREESWYAWMARSPDLVRVADLRGQFERESQLVERCPYLDAKVVEFVASVPRETRFSGHSDRGLFREAMRGLLPESLRMRSDKARYECMFSEVGSSAYANGALSRLVRMEALGDLRLVDPVAFRAALAKAVADGDGSAWGDAWPALSAEAFLLHEYRSYHDPLVCVGAVN
jgi:asparagine synthase (glutamine-hydrolysing)